MVVERASIPSGRLQQASLPRTSSTRLLFPRLELTLALRPLPLKLAVAGAERTIALRTMKTPKRPLDSLSPSRLCKMASTFKFRHRPEKNPKQSEKKTRARLRF